MPRAHRASQGGDTQKLRRACPTVTVRIQHSGVTYEELAVDIAIGVILP